jgi:uncharacterized protein YbjT (DUF2867 family)
MQKVLLFGANGQLGRKVGQELVNAGYELTVVLRDPRKLLIFDGLSAKHKIVKVDQSDKLANICEGYDIVVSTLGKSVSPYDNSHASFYEVDFCINAKLIDEAQKSGVKKFVYVSAFHSEEHRDLTYFRVHYLIEEKLKTSGLNYSIIKPPALFSAFLDMVEMAKKGQLVNIGMGNKKTNPIYEGDLAKICVGAIAKPNAIIEAGGNAVYTRRELYQIIQQSVAPSKSVKQMPLWVFKLGLPILKGFNKNLYDKFSFFLAVIEQDTVAPKMGEMRFETYIHACQ